MTVDLSGVERAINRLGYELSSQIDAVGASVGVVRHDLALTNGELSELRKQFDQFVLQAERTAAVQQSETRVVNLKAQLDREFGHYEVVRRTSVGILQAFDVGNVSNRVVSQVSEELMIQTPRYWLAPVLVALAAWSRDNKEMAEKSVREAYSRDPAKTSLFFTLVMRRQGRQEASVRWLKHYLSSLDPSGLGREFAVVLEATSFGAFGPAGQRLMTGIMRKWAKHLLDNTDAFESQVRTLVGEIGGQREQLRPGAYPALEAISPEWPVVKRLLEQSSALPVTIDKYEAIAKHEGTMPSVLEDMLDDILDQLVTEYDAEELPLKREILYHESVIEEFGNKDLARQRAERLGAALDETTDLVSMQTTAATSPEMIGVSTQTQRISVGVCLDGFKAALGRYCADYRSRYQNSVPLDFSPQHSQFAKTYGFGGVLLHTNTPEAEGIQKIQTAWEQAFADYIERVSFKNSWYIVPAMVTVVLALVGFYVAPPWGGIGALVIGGAFLYFQGESKKKAAQKLVDDAMVAREQAGAHSVAVYRDANAQYVNAMTLFRELDAQERDVLNVFNSWPTADRSMDEEI